MHATFTDSCGSIKIQVTSDIKPEQLVLVTKDDTIIDVGFVTADEPFSEDYPAAAGEVLGVYYPDMEDAPEAAAAIAKGTKIEATELITHLVAEHEHTPPSCGGLPVTGFQAGLAGLAGLVLIGAGLVLLTLTRRRRVAA